MTKYFIVALLGLSMAGMISCSSAQQTAEENANAALEQAEAAASQVPAYITVNFDFDSSIVKSKSYPIVKTFLNSIKQENIIINVDGYTDDIGTEIYNSKLSMQRAESVADFLVENGISRDIIITRGHGETNFVADNETEEGRAKNRRVEISVSK